MCPLEPRLHTWSKLELSAVLSEEHTVDVMEEDWLAVFVTAAFATHLIKGSTGSDLPEKVDEYRRIRCASSYAVFVCPGGAVVHLVSFSGRAVEFRDVPVVRILTLGFKLAFEAGIALGQRLVVTSLDLSGTRREGQAGSQRSSGSREEQEWEQRREQPSCVRGMGTPFG